MLEKCDTFTNVPPQHSSTNSMTLILYAAIHHAAINVPFANRHLREHVIKAVQCRARTVTIHQFIA